MSNTPKIDELIGDIVSLGTDHCNNPPAPQNETEAKDQLYQLILEVIGENDEWKKEYPLSIKQDIKSRNNLRLEQRQILNYLFGKDK